MKLIAPLLLMVSSYNANAQDTTVVINIGGKPYTCTDEDAPKNKCECKVTDLKYKEQPGLYEIYLKGNRVGWGRFDSKKEAEKECKNSLVTVPECYE